MEQAGFPQRLGFDERGQCAFYDRASAACRIHPVRPLLCRLFGVARDPKMICPFGCVPDGWVTNDQVREWLQQLDEIDGEPTTGSGEIRLLGVSQEEQR